MPQHALCSNFREQGALPPNSRFCPSGLWTWKVVVVTGVERMSGVKKRTQGSRTRKWKELVRDLKDKEREDVGRNTKRVE